MKKFSIFIRGILLLLIVLFINLSANASKPYTIFEYKKGIYIIEITTDKTDCKLIPFYVDGLEYNEEVYKSNNAQLVVNAGFFDPKNQKTVSYVVINENLVLDPAQNENLMNNKSLSPYIDKILNRSEFRVLRDENGQIVYDIAPHNEKIAEGMSLIHSIQAGPMLYPKLRLEEEFFVLVENGELKSESASCLHRYARTGIGIKKNRVYIFLATKDAPLTLKELADIAMNCGMEKAMAFDGGGSTSFDSKDLHIISDYDNQGRKLKSFLILKN